MERHRPELRPAQSELLDLAAATRPDIHRQDLEGAIIACHDAGWPWKRTLSETVQMLCRGEEPRDLREATRDPMKRRRTA
jgi:hypothetical protein